MDRTVHSVITGLNHEKQRILEALGDFPKADPFEHGEQVGLYQGLNRALEIVKGVLDDQLEADSKL